MLASPALPLQSMMRCEYKTPKINKIMHLRRSAANDNIFKRFFLHPFLASTIYNNTIKNKFDIG